MKTHIKTRDYAFTGEEFDLLLDEDLEMLRTDPQPKDLDRYYQDERYISHTDRSKTIQEKIYQLVKRWGLKKKESWVQRHLDKNSEILDIGAGTGSFVSYLRSQGWIAEGLEPNKKARDLALTKQVSLYEDFKAIPDKKYNGITMWHVLEHFSDLEQGLEEVLGALHKDGTLFVAVPNYKSLDAEVYGKFWAAYDVPRHLWHFSRMSINKIFGRMGLSVIETHPMPFDPFYIALLSEGYRKGKFKWLSAFWWGIRSNLYGRKTGEHSSLVYVLKRPEKPF